MSLSQTATSKISTALAVDNLAEAIVSRGLASPALLMIELHRPLLTVAYNVMIFFEPFVVPFFGFERIQAYREILQSPKNLDALVARIEELRGEK